MTRQLVRPARRIQELAQHPSGMYRAYLGEDYDGMGQYVLVALSRSAMGSGYKARIASGDFGGRRTFPAGTPVVVRSDRGTLEVFLGNKPNCGITDTFNRDIAATPTSTTNSWGTSDSTLPWIVQNSLDLTADGYVNGEEGVLTTSTVAVDVFGRLLYRGSPIANLALPDELISFTTRDIYFEVRFDPPLHGPDIPPFPDESQFFRVGFADPFGEETDTSLLWSIWPFGVEVYSPDHYDYDRDAVNFFHPVVATTDPMAVRIHCETPEDESQSSSVSSKIWRVGDDEPVEWGGTWSAYQDFEQTIPIRYMWNFVNFALKYVPSDFAPPNAAFITNLDVQGINRCTVPASE